MILCCYQRDTHRRAVGQARAAQSPVLPVSPSSEGEEDRTARWEERETAPGPSLPFQTGQRLGRRSRPFPICGRPRLGYRALPPAGGRGDHSAGDGSSVLENSTQEEPQDRALRIPRAFRSSVGREPRCCPWQRPPGPKQVIAILAPSLGQTGTLGPWLGEGPAATCLVAEGCSQDSPAVFLMESNPRGLYIFFL